MGKCSRAALLLLLASFVPLCLGSLEPTSSIPSSNDPPPPPTATVTPDSSPSAPPPDGDREVIELLSTSNSNDITPVFASDIPNSDIVGREQAEMLNAVREPDPLEVSLHVHRLIPVEQVLDLQKINEAVMATFEDGSRASILTLFNYKYRSAVLRSFFLPTRRAKLVSHYRFIRGRRENGPFTPICHTSRSENKILGGGTLTPSDVEFFHLQKSDTILGTMGAATDAARQLTVKKIVTKCGFPIPVSSADRHVIRQYNFTSCGPACVAMVGLDLGCRLPPECDFSPQIASGSWPFWVANELAKLCNRAASNTSISARVSGALPTDDDWLYVIMMVNNHFTVLSNGYQPEPSAVPPPTTAGTRPRRPMTMRDPLCGIEFQVTRAEAMAFFESGSLAFKATGNGHLSMAITIYRRPDGAPHTDAVTFGPGAAHSHTDSSSTTTAAPTVLPSLELKLQHG